MTPITPLQTGEKAIKNALPIQLENGQQCIPQHFLLFRHTRESVENIILDIEYNDNYLLFVCEDNSGIFIQIGIIGYDNFLPIIEQKKQKVVYGRKWRVEPQLPTSEIIQTVFLALKISREHEVRELFKLRNSNCVTSPFNNHHDLPLMAQNSELLTQNTSQNLNQQNIQSNLDPITYDSSSFTAELFIPISNGQWLLTLQTKNTKFSQLPETKNLKINLILTSLTLDELYYQLMLSLINLSNQQVEENFQYLGFSRFSKNNSIHSISELSSTLRKNITKTGHNDFINNFEKANYETDASRVPQLHNGKLLNKIRNILDQHGELLGILPS